MRDCDHDTAEQKKSKEKILTNIRDRNFENKGFAVSDCFVLLDEFEPTYLQPDLEKLCALVNNEENCKEIIDV